MVVFSDAVREKKRVQIISQDKGTMPKSKILGRGFPLVKTQAPTSLDSGVIIMKTLNFYSTTEVEELAWPAEQNGLSMDSSARCFFTDFQEVTPIVIESSVPAVEVKHLMQKAHVRLMFVLNDADQFIGIISADDLIDRKIVQKVSEGALRSEISLTELMTPKRDLKALDYQEVLKASISDVIRKLQDSGAQHCLVVDRNTRKIRGIFSASDISRKLHLPIDIQDRSSFYKVFAFVA